MVRWPIDPFLYQIVNCSVWKIRLIIAVAGSVSVFSVYALLLLLYGFCCACLYMGISNDGFTIVCFKISVISFYFFLLEIPELNLL